MSICDGCIHDDVCGLEDNHEEGIVSCADMIPKDVLNKIRAEIIENAKGTMNDTRAEGLYMALNIVDKYRNEVSE